MLKLFHFANVLIQGDTTRKFSAIDARRENILHLNIVYLIFKFQDIDHL